MEGELSWQAADSACRDDGEYLMTFSTAAASQWFRSKASALSQENSGRFSTSTQYI